MFQHVKVAWSRPGLTSTQRLVLLYLADRADDNGIAWPSAKTIGDACGLKDRAVRYALDALSDMGFIRRAEERQRGQSQSWLVPDDVSVVFQSAAADATSAAADAVLLMEVPHTSAAPNAGGVRHLVQGVRHQMPEGAAPNAGKATKKQPRSNQAKLPTGASAADASPKKPKPDKDEARKAANMAIYRMRKLFGELFAPVQDKDADWVGLNFEKAIRSYGEDDVAGTLRAIHAQKPNAKTSGHTLALIGLGSWVAEWLDADRPDLFPSAVIFRRSGGTNDRPVSRLVAASERIADADRVRAAREQWQAGGLAASAG